MLTRGAGLRLLGANILLGAASAAIQLLFYLVGFIVAAIAAMSTDSALNPIMRGLLLIGGCVTNLVFLLSLATLFGFVYKLRPAPPVFDVLQPQA